MARRNERREVFARLRLKLLSTLVVAMCVSLESAAADFIEGQVTSGDATPEAGVWVIAETGSLPTPLRKIVVTDAAGRFVIPQLPQAEYQVWVRGYGLVDSGKTPAAPGALAAAACDARG